MPRYFITTLVIFWVPSFVLGSIVLKKLDPLTRKAFWLTLAVMIPLTVIMEYVYLWADVWTFSQAKDPLLGIWIGPAPIEEFCFWFGAVPFALLVYLAFRFRWTSNWTSKPHA